MAVAPSDYEDKSDGSLWLIRIFEAQFGNSDVLSNYSRTYSWMANQLGHMTLGLGTAFLYFWVVSTFETVHHHIRPEKEVLGDRWLWPLLVTLIVMLVVFIARDRILKSDGHNRRGIQMIARMTPRRPGEYPLTVIAGIALLAAGYGLLTWAGLDGEFWNGPLLVATYTVLFVAILVVFGLTCWSCISAKPDLSEPLRFPAERYLPLGSHGKLGLMVAVGVAALLNFMVIWDQAAGFPGELRFLPGGLTLAFGLFGLIVLTLAKDWRYGVLGILTLLGAKYLALAGICASASVTCSPPVALERAAFALPVVALVWVVLATALLRYRHARRRFGRPQSSGETVRRIGVAVTEGLWTNLTIYVVAFGALYYHWLCKPFSTDWVIPFAAAVSSYTLWCVKEFGSDLPKVDRYIRSNRQRRLDRGAPGSDKDSAVMQEVEGQLYGDAQFDARADAVFYFSGVWIGAGVLANAPVLTDTEGGEAWVVGSEIVGLLIFVGIFLLIGRNWSYRQFALDRTGARRINRIGVIDYGLELFHWQSGLERAGGARLRYPYAILRAFARDVAIPTVKETGDQIVAELPHLPRDQRKGPPARKADNRVSFFGIPVPGVLVSGLLKEPDDPGTRPFDHLVVFDLSSGRAEISEAIASDAAIASLPTATLAQIPDRQDRRTARVIGFEELTDFARRCEADDFSAADVLFNPTIPIAMCSEPGKNPTFSRSPKPGAEIVRHFFGADLVVITDCRAMQGSLLHVPEATATSGLSIASQSFRLQDCLGGLHRNGGKFDQQTVWVFDVPGGLTHASDERKKWLAQILKDAESTTDAPPILRVVAGMLDTTPDRVALLIVTPEKLETALKKEGFLH